MRLLRSVLLFFLFLNILMDFGSFAQKETYIWYFGKHAGLNFNTTPPTVLTNGALFQMEGCSSICNQNGQLLFYTDGMTVWNKNHIAMPNGSGLNGDYHAANSGFIVKKPGSADIYYVFTAGSDISGNNLKYSIVDMSLNGALGGVTSKNILLRTNMTEKLCAVSDINNQNVWLVSHERNSNNYIEYQISATGISAAIVQSIGSLAINNPGSLMLSHCGDKLANANITTNTLDLFDFDRSTGIISNAQQISFPAGVFCLEFSSNSEFIYLAIGHPTSLYQLKVSTGLYSLIATPAIELGQMQLAPNGKIYIAEYYYPAPETYNPYNYLGVINNPESAGVSCNYVEQGLFLNSNNNTQSYRGLPSFVASLIKKTVDLGPDTSICDGSSITFHAGSGNSSYHWQDGSTDSIFTATATGMYAVTITDNCESYVDSVFLSVVSNPIPDLGNDTLICQGGSVILDPGFGYFSYLWQDGSTDSAFTVNSQGTYWCQVTTSCATLTDTVIILYGTKPVINLGPDTSICAGSSITFHAGGGYNTYLWQNGSTDSVYTATATGMYSVTVNNNCGSVSDTVRIIDIYPSPQINLGNDSSICTSISETLDAGNGFSSYYWQNGTTNQTLHVSAPGTYSVTVTGSHNCAGSDTIVFTLNDIPVITLGDDRSLCDAKNFVLDPGPGFISYLWQDGSTTQMITAAVEGTYSVTVNNDCGSATSSVSVNSCPDCICDIPNAFTPNSDGENDILFVKGSGFTDLEFTIYNRLGEKVFYSDNIDFGWDGKFLGLNQKNETFIYVIKAKCLNNEHVFLKGNVTLLR